MTEYDFSDKTAMPETPRKLLAFYAKVDAGDQVTCWPIRQQHTPRARRLLIAGDFIDPDPGFRKPTVTPKGRAYLASRED
jgi:hypothetical protein